MVFGEISILVKKSRGQTSVMSLLIGDVLWIGEVQSQTTTVWLITLLLPTLTEAKILGTLCRSVVTNIDKERFA